MKTYPAFNLVAAPSTLQAIRLRHPLALEAQKCGPSSWEIGHGCRWGPYPGLVITPHQAEDLFRADIQYVEARIRSLFSMRMPDSAFQALVSFFFDCGFGGTFVDDTINLFAQGDFRRWKEGLPPCADLSRFGRNVGITARFWEAKTVAL